MSLVNYASNPRVTITYPINNSNNYSISFFGNTLATSSTNLLTNQTSGTYTSPDLSFNTKYTFTIIPYNMAGVSGYPKTMIMDTTPNIAGVYTTNSTSANASLKWITPYNTVKVNRAYATGTGQTTMLGNSDISTNVTNSYYIDTDMFGNTTYKYTITPYIGDISYAASTPITVSTNPQAAGNLYAGSIGTSTIQVYFNYPKNNYTGSISYKLRTTDNLFNVVGTSSPLQLTNLNSNTTYSLVVDTSMSNGTVITTSSSITSKTLIFLGNTIVTAIYIPTSSTAYKVLTSNSFDITSIKNAFFYTGGHYDLSCSSSADRPTNNFEAFRAANNYNGSYFWASAYANNGIQGYSLNPYKSDGTYQGGGLASNTYNTVIGGVSVSGEWIQYRLPYLLNLKSYSLQSNASNRIASTIYIAGSNDGNTWSLIDVSSGISVQTFSQPVSTGSTYSYYRLVINKEYTGADGIAGINYWNIYGYISMNLTPQALDIDSNLIIWLKGNSGDINSSTGVVTNYGVNTGVITSTVITGTNGSTVSTTKYKFGTSSLYNYNSNSGVSCTLNLPSQNWCFSFWWNPDRYVGVNGNTSYQVLMAIGSGPNYGVWNSGSPPTKNPTVFQWVGSSQSGSPTLSYNFALDTWYHVVINTQANVCSWYVNNVFCISGNNPYLNISNNSSQLLQLTGQSTTSTQYVPGYFADVRFYGRTLTTTEISSLYNYTNTNY